METPAPPRPPLARVLAEIERRHAAAAGRPAGRRLPPIPTGSPSLDAALGGGWPRGRLAEAFGADASGKTALALLACAAVQRAGGAASLLDVEHALDLRFARRIGVDLRRLILSRPRNAEEAVGVAEALVRSNAVDLIAVDTAAALAPRAEIARRLSEADDFAPAAFLGAALRGLSALLRRSRACLLLLNQTRFRPGPGGREGEGTPGGRTLRLLAFARVEVERLAAPAAAETLRLRVRVVKNRAPGGRRIAEVGIPLR